MSLSISARPSAGRVSRLAYDRKYRERYQSLDQESYDGNQAADLVVDINRLLSVRLASEKAFI